MDPETFIDPNLTRADLIVLNDLLYDVDATKKKKLSKQSKNGAVAGHREKTNIEAEDEDDETVQKLDAMNDPAAPEFEPTVFSSYDLKDLQQHPRIYRYLLLPYINFARKIVRVETDVVILTHLIIYCCTSIPSALLLYRHFTIAHGITHWLLQGYYTGTYTLLMHQHIHMGGVLSKRSVVIRLFDELFPYVLNPLMGHTWNSYYYHHTKHHHVEANGPDDLSSTIRYQRDSLVDFLQYVGRFLFLIWFDLPLYFIRKGKPWLGVKTGFWELGNYAAIVALLLWADRNATIFVFILPLLQLRLGLMVGNWGQHALVDDVDPKSDMRSSITLIDVPSNRFCFNDGYHTSHHLNPRRHWRDHPAALLRQKHHYAEEKALIFRNTDFLMVTVRLLRKDYRYLAKCLVPIGEEQIRMSLDERAAMLRRKTRRFTEQEIRAKF